MWTFILLSVDTLGNNMLNTHISLPPLMVLPGGDQILHVLAERMVL